MTTDNSTVEHPDEKPTLEKVFHNSDLVRSSPPNPRGIMPAPFINDVDKFMETCQFEVAFRLLNELYQKYKYMERSLAIKKAALEKKIPEIQKSLTALDHLIEKKDQEEPHVVDFLLHENVYAQATLKKSSAVGLWLGANVMVEYSHEDAKELLTKNLNNAKITLNSINEDFTFLKEQLTICEVGIARIFNYDVKKRREAKLAQKASS
ncbi:putative prefoldin subunit 3 [Monocercomonoides exilis]|uniref:putative prefoldin subunit 3 n=1 Tax=Monocercomonoides exilis TaxID=2049356 RepID=UPI003559D33B|nr:putative prefoldin subunit 3 [Monocercomonoides exilis]|eukprot:MONOS_504.1-p1 / transcript=MONOS_504.1 / gene=MONOS_504 / organism=Monocercomonoides_exilis_PA203 / gene_product=prefoldin subunit 3, putative / transcript_product=prefoldin subunit 3, putative / location=Mono_scaffold00008:55615-56510(-) / protein_length=207 / sequence_SO=supercontig / SO=protein_coding / is_pseudo=false